MYLHPAHHLLLQRQRPNVIVTDVLSDVTAATTYTFTAANVGGWGSAFGRNLTYGTDPYIRAANNRAVAVIVHSENSAATFTVSSCTIGGVAGSKLVDRGGGTIPVNTAIFVWAPGILDKIANTNIVVTHSVAVTGCAIGVLEIDNLRLIGSSTLGLSNGFSSAGAAFSLSTVPNTTAVGYNMINIGGTTCLDPAQTYTPGDPFASSISISGLGHIAPITLYEGANANFAYAGMWFWYPGYPSYGTNNLGRWVIDWTGTADFDAASAALA